MSPVRVRLPAPNEPDAGPRKRGPFLAIHRCRPLKRSGLTAHYVIRRSAPMRNAFSRATLIAGLLAIILSFPVHAQQPSLDDLVRTAHFIFIGDVVKLGSTTMASVVPSANTAVVRVS